MRLQIRHVVIGVGALLVTTMLPTVTTAPAVAHDSGVLIVPRINDSRPTPRLDASCEPEYAGPANRRPVLYRPGYNFNPATFSVITKGDYLYVCVQGLSRTPPSATSQDYLAIALDVDHDGGAVPDSEDKVFTIDEAGRLTQYRGTSAGFVPIAGRGAWNAVTNPQQEVSWNAEFRFLMPSFGLTAGRTSGIQVRHTSLVQHNDVFPWPTGSANRQPQSWGDMVLLGESVSTPGQVRVDRARVTQSLQWDVAQSANKAYELVERKDAYLSAQLYTLGAITDLAYSACQVQRIAPSGDSVQTVPTAAPPTPVIAPYPTGVQIRPPVPSAAGSPARCCPVRASTASPYESG